MEKSFSSECICLRCFPNMTGTSVPHFCTYGAYAWHLSIRMGILLLPWNEAKSVRPSKGQLEECARWPTPGNFQVCSSHTNCTVSCKSRFQLKKPHFMNKQGARGAMTWGEERGQDRLFHCSIMNRLNDANGFEKKTCRGSSHGNQDSSYKQYVLFMLRLVTTRNVITFLLKNNH